MKNNLNSFLFLPRFLLESLLDVLDDSELLVRDWLFSVLVLCGGLVHLKSRSSFLETLDSENLFNGIAEISGDKLVKFLLGLYYSDNFTSI